MFILNLLVNFYTTSYSSQSEKRKGYEKATVDTYFISFMANYGTPNISYHSLTTDDYAFSTDSWR